MNEYYPYFYNRLLMDVEPWSLTCDLLGFRLNYSLLMVSLYKIHREAVKDKKEISKKFVIKRFGHDIAGIIDSYIN